LFKEINMKKMRLEFALVLLVAFIQAPVVNPDKPLKGEWNFRLEKVWEVDRAGDDVLGRPFSLTAAEEGILYVYDTANNATFIFDKDGNFIRAFARSGQGPGEVMGQELIHLVNGKVFIPARNGIKVFTKDGEFIQTVKQEGRPLDPCIFLNEDEIISAPKTAVFLPDGKGEIIRKNIKTGEEALISEFSLQDWGMAQSRGQQVDIISIGFSPLMILGYAENRLYWGMNTSYMINVSDLNGKKISTFSVKRRSRKVSDNFKKKYFDAPNLPPEMLTQIADSFPNDISFFHRIEVHNGLVYVFVPDVDLENKRAKLKQIDIFSPDGEYLYRAYIKFEKNRQHLFSPLNSLVIQNGYLYAVLLDEEYNVLVAKYKIALPNGI
jgi:hypothetical protein